MNQEQTERVRRRRSRAEAAQLAAEFEASGLAREEFCRKHGVSLATLARYRRLGQRQGERAHDGRWLAVELSGPNWVAARECASGLAIVLRTGIRIDVGRGFDANTLEQLLRTLEPA